MADAAQVAGQVLGGSCGAVAGSLMHGVAVLPSESAEAILVLHVVHCVLEILRNTSLLSTIYRIPTQLLPVLAIFHRKLK